MLQPLTDKTEPVQGTDSPTVTCEACGKTGPSHLMINFMAAIGSPGHHTLNGFQCPGSGQIDGRPEHWACSTECWLLVARACLDEHLLVLLKSARQSVGIVH